MITHHCFMKRQVQGSNQSYYILTDEPTIVELSMDIYLWTSVINDNVNEMKHQADDKQSYCILSDGPTIVELNMDIHLLTMMITPVL